MGSPYFMISSKPQKLCDKRPCDIQILIGIEIDRRRKAFKKIGASGVALVHAELFVAVSLNEIILNTERANILRDIVVARAVASHFGERILLHIGNKTVIIAEGIAVKQNTRNDVRKHHISEKFQNLIISCDGMLVAIRGTGKCLLEKCFILKRISYLFFDFCDFFFI